MDNIKFISYSGEYPHLCIGTLKLEINGEEVTFGSEKADYPKFWRSGGGLDENCFHYAGTWIIDVNLIPEKYRKYAYEINRVFNKNVEYGCCGGCE